MTDERPGRRRRTPLFARLAATLDTVLVARVVVGLHAALVAVLLWMAARLGLIVALADEASFARLWLGLLVGLAVVVLGAAAVVWSVRRWLRTGKRGLALGVDLLVLLASTTLLLPLLLVDAAPLVAIGLAAAAIVALGIAPSPLREDAAG